MSAGRVIETGDGDTVTIDDSSKQQYKILFYGNDIPGKGQPCG